MTAFDDKEKAAENKYAHDRETEFKIHARAMKMVGLWAGEKMGLSTSDTEAYAVSLITVDVGKSTPDHLLEKIKNDLLAHEIHISEHDIRARIHQAEATAREQIAGAD